ncbi:hypothetical protein B6N60_02273 [Richelia sinica FACHB-800]|uniref:Uncharacterized protein n=1 Tax=Richelia sinica FACHB-800 TaxID=1357546 RepID=A0A975T7F3_9NOST|nr:hypothetical protein B6N60_02273 [Richelia sinica FACHB-800]
MALLGINFSEVKSLDSQFIWCPDKCKLDRKNQLL